MHISELAAVALVKNDDDVLAKDGVPLVLPHENIQLLNGGDDNFSARVLHLLLQHGGVGIAVGRALFKAVVLLHGLVVQIFSVHHEEHLVDVRELRGQLGSLEGGQGFAAAGGMPDVAAGLNGSAFFVVGGHLDPVQDALGGCDLIGPHDHQQVL